MKSRKEQIDDFYGKLKDPYYGRPIVLEKSCVGSQFNVMNTTTNEIITCYCHAENVWNLWGTSRHLEKDLTILSHTELELLLGRFWNLAQDGEEHWVIEDPAGCTLMAPKTRLMP